MVVLFQAFTMKSFREWVRRQFLVPHLTWKCVSRRLQRLLSGRRCRVQSVFIFQIALSSFLISSFVYPHTLPYIPVVNNSYVNTQPLPSFLYRLSRKLLFDVLEPAFEILPPRFSRFLLESFSWILISLMYCSILCFICFGFLHNTRLPSKWTNNKNIENMSSLFEEEMCIFWTPSVYYMRVVLVASGTWTRGGRKQVSTIECFAS